MAATSASSDVSPKPWKRDANAFPLDERMFTLLREQDLELIKTYTGIQDHEQLKAHIIAIQKEAYPVMPYQCIRYFSFAASRMNRIPNYDHILKLAKEREGAIFLDVGACFGTDLRKVVSDGWDVKNVVATDINSEFWAMGHKLFHTTPASFPAPFVPGNALTDEHLQTFPILPTGGSAVDAPRPDLSSLTSLNPLRGHVSAIHVANVFHLFSEHEQLRLARGLAGLLSPAAGSIIAGWHMGGKEKGEKTIVRGTDESTFTQFLHSPESWTALWDGEVFAKGVVKVDAALVYYKNEYVDREFFFLRWSMIRL